MNKSDLDNLDSDLLDVDLEIFGCDDIIPKVERITENNGRICDPRDEVHGTTTSKLIKETQWVRLKFFNDMTPDEDRGLIATYTRIFYWYC